MTQTDSAYSRYHSTNAPSNRTNVRICAHPRHAKQLTRQATTSGDDNAFLVTYRGESVHVRAATPRQCIAWTKAIGDARGVCLKALERRARSGGEVRAR